MRKGIGFFVLALLVPEVALAQTADRWVLIAGASSPAEISIDTQTIVVPRGNPDPILEVWLKVERRGSSGHRLLRRSVWCSQQKWNISQIVAVSGDGSTRREEVPVADVGYSSPSPESYEEAVFRAICEFARR